jgi:16S rRNA (guanine(1405)-N(7))-methyltransferase
MTNDPVVENLVKKIQANKKYETIMPELVLRLAEKALAKGFKGKTAVKDVRNKLHQIGGAYYKRQVNYENAREHLAHLPRDIKSDQARQFCLKFMGAHASTAERIPILEKFFKTALEPIAPVTIILDLACGMTPLSIHWMPLGEGFTYHACDIYLDMLSFIQTFFNHFDIHSRAFPCDLGGSVPEEHAQVALLLKSIPCLEQVDKEIGLNLLEGVRADHILVSFPVSSLGGRKKGMADFYQEHFYEMVSRKTWQIRRFEFDTELAFLVTK